MTLSQAVSELHVDDQALRGTAVIRSYLSIFVFMVLLNTQLALTLTIQDFYPFGPKYNDMSLAQGDDVVASTLLDFPFFGEKYTTIGISTNGLLSLNATVNDFSPRTFPTDGVLIAPYWADADTRGIGSVYYRTTTNETLLSRISMDISSFFVGHNNFLPQILFIATWVEVGYFNMHIDKNNTFQCVLATNRESSFVVFMYKEEGIQWTTGDAMPNGGVNGLGGVPATVGFNAGDMVNFATVTGSNTAAVINISTTSNIGIPGKWAFQVNNAIVTDINECSTGQYRQCDNNADCINTIGSFTCQCRDGFFEDGMKCEAGLGPDIETTIMKVNPNHDLNYTIGTNFCLEDSPLNRVINQTWFISCELANQPTPMPNFMMTTVVVKNEVEMELTQMNRSWTLYDLNTTLDILLQEGTAAIKVTCIVFNEFGSDNASTIIELCGPTECQDGITNACTQICSRDNGTMTYNCSCINGYIVNMEDLDICDDIDECANPDFYNNCSATENLECHNTNGSFTCECKAGYNGRSDGQCEDIDECLSKQHNCSQDHNEECQNTNGSFACICKEGFRRVDTIQQCLDIDECIENDYTCSVSENEMCINNNGSFTCECTDGYSRNTTSGLCYDSRECNPPCHRLAVCTNTPSGMFGCKCRVGYDGDGINSCQVSVSDSVITDVVAAVVVAVGAVSFLLLIGIILTIVCICYNIIRRNSSYDVKDKDNLDIKGPHLDNQVDEPMQTFSVQSSYKLNLPPHLIIHSSSIKLVEPIGQGEFGIVYKGHIVKDPGPVVTDVVAIKTLKGFYDKSTVREMMKECSKMYKFDHPNILTLKGVCLDGGPAPYIIMPFMTNGSLLAYLHKNRDSLVCNNRDKVDDKVEIVKKQLTDICLQIARGMEYLTVMKVVHRDLAARNCMIDMNFVIKVADFGLSEGTGTKHYFRQDKLANVKLPIKWLAPESLEDCVFSQKSDVWAYGVTCWEVFTGGKNPYPGIPPSDLPRQLANGHRLEKPMNYVCSDEMYAFMLNCWNLDPNARPSFSDLVSSLSQSLEDMVGYMDVPAIEKLVDKNSVVEIPCSKDKICQSEHISSDVCVETVM